MLYSAQIRAARGLLKMSQVELSLLTDINISSIKKYEMDDKFLRRTNLIKLNKILKVFKERNIEFFEKQEEDGSTTMGAAIKKWQPPEDDD